MLNAFKAATGLAVLALIGAALAVPAFAQEQTWVDQKLLAAAKKHSADAD